MKHNKAFRVLYMYDKLLKGNGIKKKEVSEYFQVDYKTVQRDIDELRDFLDEVNSGGGKENLYYDHCTHSYRLRKQLIYFFTGEETLALAKILLDSRAFNENEMTQILNKLLLHIDLSKRSCFKNAILNESHNYIQPQHGKKLLSILWQLNLSIQEQNKIKITYCRMDGTIRDWVIEPQGLIFSEYYFYLIALLYNAGHDNPVIFRIDRIKSLLQTTEKFPVSYTERFKEGEFRKRIQFMYGGELIKVKFAFWGSSLEAVLDRLPTAQIVGEDGNKTILEAEVYGNGIKMWFLSQGACLEVLEPESLRKEMIDIVNELANLVYADSSKRKVQ